MKIRGHNGPQTTQLNKISGKDADEATLFGGQFYRNTPVNMHFKISSSNNLLKGEKKELFSHRMQTKRKTSWPDKEYWNIPVKMKWPIE